MRSVYVSAVASRRLARARRFLARGAPSEPGLIVVPSALAATRLIAPLVVGEGEGEGARFALERVPLHALALRLALPVLARRGVVPLTRLGAEAMVARAIDRVARAGDLGRLTSVRDRPGLPRALCATLDELALAGIDAERVRPHAPELAAVHEAFARELQAAQLVDRATVLQLAAERARERPGVPTLWLDVPIAHRLERELAQALLAGAPSALATVPAGDERTLHALDGVLLREPEDERELWDGALTRVQSHLFEPAAPAGALEGQVEILSAPGEGRECVEIARALLQSARAGVPFERMAVWTRRAASYRAHLEETLARAGIPAFFAEGSERPDPGGRALLALLRCAREGGSARAFAEYLSLDVLPSRLEVEGGRPSPRRFERLIHESAAIGGRVRFERRLRGRRADLERERADREREGVATVAIDRALADLDCLLGFLPELLARLEALPERATFGAWIAQLDALAVAALRAPGRVRELLAELAPLGEIGPVSLDHVMRVLSPALRELRDLPGNDAAGRVLVAEAQQARGLDFELVCVLGLAEKAFPEPVREDPLLLDAVRARLEQLSQEPALATNASRAAEERLQLRLAIGAARARIVLSYPRLDLDRGRPRVPSFYGLEVLRAAEGVLPGYETLMRRAEDASSARLGWPAPRDPARAIDATEHDLACLHAILASREGRGAARYLLGVSPHLARALRFRARRWMISKWTDADGLIDPAAPVALALAARGPSARPMSPTALELYTQCPYRFYVRSVLGLGARERPGPIEDLDPRARGALMHDVMAEVLAVLHAEPSWPLDEGGRQRAHERLRSAMHAVAERYREELAPTVPRVFDDAVRATRADLQRWLDGVLDAREWRPKHAEAAFGGSGALRVVVEAGVEGGVQLSGRIDSVEERVADAQYTELRATDFKTGKVQLRVGARLAGGAVLQPVLYALALEQLEPEHAVWGGRLDHCTRAGGFSERAVPLDAEARASAREALAIIDGAVQTAFLPAAPSEGACERCELVACCGPYEPQRVARKDTSRLEALRRLRSMP